MTEKNQVHEETFVSRRDFLKTTGKTVAGVAIAGSAMGLFTSCQAAYETTYPEKQELTYEYVQASQEPAPYPFPYQKLDPTTCAERAYAAYQQKGGWGVGVAEGFFGELGEKAGYPFNQINPETFKGHGGGYGLATLCGSLGAGAVAISSVVPKEDAPAIISEFFNWYKTFEFPEFQPEYEGKLKKTVADSYLCGDSVGNFMKEMEVNYKDPERKARCAGNAADCTRKIVELINAYYKL